MTHPSSPQYDLADDAKSLDALIKRVAARIGSPPQTSMRGTLAGFPIQARVYRQGGRVSEGRSFNRVRLELTLPLRGFIAALRPRNHVGVGFPAIEVVVPALAAKRSLDAAPREVGQRVFDAEVQAMVAAINDGSQHGIDTLTIGQGAVRLANDAPSDEHALDVMLSLMSAFATRIPTAIDALAGPGGLLHTHPDVVAAIRAESRGRALAIVVLVLVLAATTALIVLFFKFVL